MKKAYWLLAVACVWGCGGNQPGANTLANSGAFKQPNGTPANAKVNPALLKGASAKVIAAGNELGFKLFADAAKGAEGNVLVSPIGVSTLLSLANNLFDAEGQTAFNKALKFEGIKLQEVNEAVKQLRAALPEADTSAEFRLGNSVWTAEGVKFGNDFLTNNRKYYGAKTGPLALKAVNSWSQDASGGRVKEIFKEKDLEVPGAFLNAAGVAATFGHPTVQDDFTPAKGDAVKAQFIAAEGSFDYYKAEGVEGVKIPIQGDRLALYVLIPENAERLTSLTASLTGAAWMKMSSEFAAKPVSVMFPAIKDATEHSLNAALEAVGISTTLKKMSPKPFLVRQKSFIELSGGASEPAAPAAGVGQSVSVKADRPFIYVVEDLSTRSILLVGLYNKPEATPARKE